jgi:hypothetical protein
MLDAPGFVTGWPGSLLKAEALAASGSFCLLGEPGAGKTTALEAIAARLRCLTSGGHGPVVFVPMAEITDAGVFRERVIVPVTAETSVGGRVTLVLDGLDECPVRGAGKALAGLLRQLLQQADASALRLLVGCRSSEYPQVVHDVLAEAFPDFTRYELAPLRRRDVLELAASRAVPAEDFLNEVTRTGTGPLASIPLTLDLLLRQYAASGGLHGTAAELYESALLALAGEHDADRDPALAPAPAGQVLAVAARLCCYLLVCGRAGFWTGPTDQVPLGDLDPSALVGGEERQAGGTFEVTGPLVAAALRSALFTSSGPYRRVPAHARFAACLAGRYLASRRLPTVQLRSLLTVPGENGTGIIPALRETAAWLLALQPSDTAWADDANLTVLTVHGALIDAPELRAALVERILASPHLFTGLGWRRGWNLNHPGLVGQLAPILNALADSGSPQPGPDQAYVALRLARQADPAGVITSVLKAIARPGLDHGLRVVAARTAATLDEAAAVPVLALVLAEVSENPERDPDDELRGIALSLLWPGYLAADVLAASLTTPQRDHMLGAYYMFRRRLPGLLSDDDVPHLLSWAPSAGPGHPRAAGAPGGEGRLSRDDGDLAEGLLDRAFACRDTDAVISQAAALAARCLQDGRDLPIPAALDDRDAAGELTSESRRLRRLLAVRLLSEESDGLAVHRLIWGWQPSQAAQERDAETVRGGGHPSLPSWLGLLGPTDLRWALEMGAGAGPEKAATWTEVLRGIWDPQDRDAQEAAWQTRGTPLWAAFSSSFEQVTLGSDAEAVQRSIFNATRPRPSVWEGAAAHAAEVLDLYRRAVSEATAFLGLVNVLHVDPGDGHVRPVADDDLASRPGITLLPPGWEQHTHQAAWHDLHQGTPPGPGILDTPDQLPLTALAGYLALAFLVRHQAPCGAARLPDDAVLAHWASSVLVTRIGADSPQGPDPRQVLLESLAGSATADLPGLAGRLIEGYLATRTWPSRLESLDAAYSDDLAATLTRCLGSAVAALAAFLPPGSTMPDQQQLHAQQQLDSLRRTLTVLTEILARHGSSTAATGAVISAATAPGAGEAAQQAGRAVALGLAAGDPRGWTRLAGQLGAAPGLLREVLRDLARDPGPLTDHLTEEELGELWGLLDRHWPHGPSLVSGFVGPDEQARHWRDAVLGVLARRGTAGAVRVLRQLAVCRPDVPALASRAREAEELRLGQEWSPVRAEDLTALLEDSAARLVRGSADLAGLVHRAVLEAAGTLVRTGQLLWDFHLTDKKEMWRPKSEVAFGAWLAEQLRASLERSGVVISREVRVRETTTQHGMAVDIQADAPLTGGRQDEPARCRIELKGNWHSDLMTAMRTQLADDYLIPEGLRHGIYVTAWFDTGLWNDSADHRRRLARTRDQGETAAELDSQAESLRDLGLDVRVVVVCVPRPEKSARRDPLPGRGGRRSFRRGACASAGALRQVAAQRPHDVPVPGDAGQGQSVPRGDGRLLVCVVLGGHAVGRKRLGVGHACGHRGAGPVGPPLRPPLVGPHEHGRGVHGQEVVDHVPVQAAASGDDRGEVGQHGRGVAPPPSRRAVLEGRAQQPCRFRPRAGGGARQPCPAVLRVVAVQGPYRGAAQVVAGRGGVMPGGQEHRGDHRDREPVADRVGAARLVRQKVRDGAGDPGGWQPCIRRRVVGEEPEQAEDLYDPGAGGRVGGVREREGRQGVQEGARVRRHGIDLLQ